MVHNSKILFEDYLSRLFCVRSLPLIIFTIVSSTLSWKGKCTDSTNPLRTEFSVRDFQFDPFNKIRLFSTGIMGFSKNYEPLDTAFISSPYLSLTKYPIPTKYVYYRKAGPKLKLFANEFYPSYDNKNKLDVNESHHKLSQLPYTWPDFTVSPLITTNSQFEAAVSRYKNKQNSDTIMIHPTPQPEINPSWFYPKNIDQFRSKLKSLDRVYMDRSKSRSLKKGDKRLEFNNSTGFYQINFNIISALQQEYESLVYDPSPQKPYRSKCILQVLDILEYTIIPLRSTAIALLLLREAGMKLKGEELYFIRYGTYKSSILRRVENIIMA